MLGQVEDCVEVGDGLADGVKVGGDKGSEVQILVEGVMQADGVRHAGDSVVGVVVEG